MKDILKKQHESNQTNSEFFKKEIQKSTSNLYDKLQRQNKSLENRFKEQIQANQAEIVKSQEKMQKGIMDKLNELTRKNSSGPTATVTRRLRAKESALPPIVAKERNV